MQLKIARVAIIACLGVATLAYGALDKRITVRVEGEPVSVRTFAGTVAGALERAGVEVGSSDSVRPVPATSIGDGSVIEVQRAKTITLLLDGRARTVTVTGLTIKDVLEEIELRTRLIDRVRPARASRVEPGMTIKLDRAADISVAYDETVDRVITNARSVGQVVRELGIKLGKRDLIRPAIDRRPRPGMKIRVLRVGVKNETKTYRLSYRTILRRDRDLEYGTRKTIQEGSSGIKRVRYRTKYVDGKVVSRKVLSSSIVRRPRDRIIAIGAGYPGCSCNKGSESGKASWYRQADGMTAAHRTLPFGTVVRVENVANGKWINVTIRDRGPYIDGRIIDLSDEAFQRLASLSAGVINVRIFW